MWIDPKDPLRMIEGNDGGATISFNGGASWSSLYNQPTAEYYHITADTRTPYRLYAAQQDNSSISSPTRSSLSGILWQDCYEVGGGEAGHIAVRPDDPNVVFAAHHARPDRRRVSRDHLRLRRVAARAWGPVGRKRRRTHPSLSG